jgi:hypothetical protein
MKREICITFYGDVDCGPSSKSQYGLPPDTSEIAHARDRVVQAPTVELSYQYPSQYSSINSSVLLLVTAMSSVEEESPSAGSRRISTN